MIAPIFDIDVKINNEHIPTDTATDLRQIYEYLGRILDWLDEAPRFRKMQYIQSPQENDTAPQAVIQPAQFAHNLQEIYAEVNRIVAEKPASRMMTTKDYAILAVGLARGAVSSTLAMEIAKNLGWQTRAKDEKNALRTFEVMARLHQNLIATSKGTMRLTPAGWEEFERLKNPEPEEDNDEDIFAQDFVIDIVNKQVHATQQNKELSGDDSLSEDEKLSLIEDDIDLI